MKLCERRNRWSTLAAVLLGLVASAQAYDEDHVQAHLQPFVGVYLGAYQNSTDDINNILPDKKNDFSSVLPGGGVSLGVAYDRFHAGFEVGYQMPNYNTLSEAERVANSGYVPLVVYGKSSACPDTGTACYVLSDSGKSYAAFKNFNYDIIPVDMFAEVTVFKNSSYVNFLIGGSIGAGFMTLNQPNSVYNVWSGDTLKTYYGTGGYNGADKEALFLYTGYVGARINIAERLNLEGQIGWRGLFSDEIYYADCDCEQYASSVRDVVVDPETGVVTRAYTTTERKYRFDLSGAYLRADLRWTFASQAEKDADRTSMRRQALDDARIASAYRLR